MGTNNDGSFSSGTTSPTSAYQYGRAWSNNVTTAENGLTLQGESAHVAIEGGFDNEVSFGTAANTLGQMNGFYSINGNFGYDYGDAAGCPLSGTANCITVSDRNDGTNNVWTVDQRFQMAWGLARSFSIPQIYTTSNTMAAEWGNLARYGAHYLSNSIWFSGTLSQLLVCQEQNHPPTCSGAENSPSTSWTTLENQVNSEADTAQTIAGSYDIGIESYI